MGLRDQVEGALREKGVENRTVLNCMLIVEEACMLIREKNGNKAVNCECTVIVKEDITMILRDDGVIFDMTDVEADVSSLRQFVVASIMERQEGKKYLKTTGINRNVFRFER